MKKGYRLCIKLPIGNGLVAGFEKLEEALQYCRNTGAVWNNDNYILLDENNNEIKVTKEAK